MNRATTEREHATQGRAVTLIHQRAGRDSHTPQASRVGHERPRKPEGSLGRLPPRATPGRWWSWAKAIRWIRTLAARPQAPRGRYSVGRLRGHIYSSPRNDGRSSPGRARVAAEAGDYPGIWDLPGRCGGLAVRLPQGGGDKRFRRIGMTDMIPTTPVLGRFID